MRRTHAVLLAGALCLPAGCSDYLDVNTNPNAPQSVSAYLYLPPMLHWMVTAPQFDGIQVGQYTQQWQSVSSNFSPAATWGRMGYDPASDAGAWQWRVVYWNFGQNLIDMNTKAEAEQRWDLLGVGLILKAWGWQVLTDLHGEIIVKEAIDQSKFTFNYDSQEYAYQEVDRLLHQAIAMLQRTDGAVDQAYLARGDNIYNGDRTKWLKFAYGMLALHLNHYSNKSSYDPDSIIKLVDMSFASNADDALLTYPNTNNDDTNFLGRTRSNLTFYRQSKFIVGLLDGTQFGGVVDPRLARMLSTSPDSGYRGLDPDTLRGTNLTASEMPKNLFGYVGTGGLRLPGRYLFDDKAKVPAMTYAQLQFVKAEAALRAGQDAIALDAYTKAISAHIDFVNARNTDNGQTPTQITAAEKAAFLASPEIVPTSPADLTLSHVMSQKFIAQWAWGHNELWMDMRRYNYTDMDPELPGVQVFRGFRTLAVYYQDNNGLPVQRIRPRYNSEYVWNQAGLEPIGGLEPDYHTKPLWITEP